MTTVGIFAGRGDVILAMGLALTCGVWLGWQARKAIDRFRVWRLRHRREA